MTAATVDGDLDGDSDIDYDDYYKFMAAFGKCVNEVDYNFDYPYNPTYSFANNMLYLNCIESAIYCVDF